MSAPRIEVLLVSLVVLIATGVALTAAYAPPIPRQPPVELLQAASRETNAPPATLPTQLHNDDRQAASDPVSLVDRTAQWIDRIATNEGIMLPVIGSVASLMLTVVVVQWWRHAVTRRRSACAREEAGTSTHKRPEDQRVISAEKWSTTIRRWNAGARRHIQTWIVAVRGAPTLPNAIRVLQYARNVRLQRRYEHHVLHLQNRTSVSVEDSHPIDPKADVHDLTAALQHSSTPFVSDAAKDSHYERDAHALSGRETHVPGGQDASAPGGGDAHAPSDVKHAPDTSDDPATLATDSAAAAVAAVLDMYERQGLTQSKVVFAEANVTRWRTQVRLTVAAHPDESSTLATLPEQAQTSLPEARAQWQYTASVQPVLNVALRCALPALRGSPMLLPVARHQPIARLSVINRSTPAVSFLPLRTWRHVGFYGGKAVESASSALVDLLYIEAPETLAVTIIDHGQISSLCAGTPHMVPPPGTAADSLMALGRAVRFFPCSDPAMRQLLIVLVEPDAAMLRAYGDLVARLLRRADVPVYTLLVQTHQADALRRLPLAAVITGSGTGRSSNETDQPPPRSVRIVAPHMRIERPSYVYDPMHLAALTAVLRSGTEASFRSAVWDAIAS